MQSYWYTFGIFCIITAGLILYLFLPLPNALARDAIGERVSLKGPLGSITTYQSGTGPCLLFQASAGREASDFNELVESLNTEGFKTVTIEAGGIKGTDIAYANTLLSAAESLKTVKEASCAKAPVTVIGHAFGNRVVRNFAAQYPNDTDRVILLAAGGNNEIDPEINRYLKNAFNPAIMHIVRVGYIRKAFFVGLGDTPRHWTRGWYTRTAIAQNKAKTLNDVKNWEAAGGKPMLIVHPELDKIAPKAETTDILKQRFPKQVDVIVIDDAAHALLPEQLEAVAKAVINYLKK